MDLIVISDTQIAKVWDRLNSLPQQRSGAFLNPNEEFRKMVKKINSDQVLVINGDLVDYYHANYKECKASNWDLFYEILNDCKAKKVYLNLGNHDYKGIAYNFFFYGLKHLNVPFKLLKQVAIHLGHVKFRLFKELDALKVNLKKFNTLKKYKFKKFYSKQIANAELVFLDTGHDILGKVRNLLNPKNWIGLLKFGPRCTGLCDKQIAFLQRILQKKNDDECLLFLHSPAFFYDKILPDIKLTKSEYEKVYKKLNLGIASFIKNNWTFMESLLNSKRNITVFTSHTAFAKQYVIDKEKKILREINLEELNELRADSRFVKFASTLPLGELGPNRKIGYLRVTKDEIEYRVLKSFAPATEKSLKKRRVLAGESIID